jgi:hypothetical protein
VIKAGRLFVGGLILDFRKEEESMFARMRQTVFVSGLGAVSLALLMQVGCRSASKGSGGGGCGGGCCRGQSRDASELVDRQSSPSMTALDDGQPHGGQKTRPVMDER